MPEISKNIEIWSLEKLIQTLEAAKGNGTSMFSLIMPPPIDLFCVNRMLDEYPPPWSGVNCRSNLGALTSAQVALKHYIKVPPSNGVVLYTGNMVTDDGKEKRVTVDFEPFEPINASLCLRDDKFHTEALYDLLEESDDNKFSFIVMDENEALFGTSIGNTRGVLRRFTAYHMDHRVTSVSGRILPASEVKLFQERCLLSEYLQEMTWDTWKYALGVDYTLKCLEMGAVETLIVWENLDIIRYVLKNRTTDEMIVKHLYKYQEGKIRDAEANAELEVEEKMPLLDWLAHEYTRFGCALELVTNKSPEGSIFCSCYGGIGGILRYQLDISSPDHLSDDDDVGEIRLSDATH